MPAYPNLSKPADVGLYAGRVFRLELELNITAGATQVLRVTAPIAFTLRKQTFSIATGALRWTAKVGGTPSGTYSTALTPVGMNRQSTRPLPLYSPVITWDTGGQHSGGTQVDLVILESAGGSSTQSNIQSDPEYRFLPAGTYYLAFQNTGNSALRGVFHLIFEETP